MKKWIDVNEKLPEMVDTYTREYWDSEEECEVSDPVIVFHHDETFSSECCIAVLTRMAGEGPVWNEVETTDLINDVVAWMPIPDRSEFCKED